MELIFNKKTKFDKYEDIFNNLDKIIENLEEKRDIKFTINEFLKNKNIYNM